MLAVALRQELLELLALPLASAAVLFGSLALVMARKADGRHDAGRAFQPLRPQDHSEDDVADRARFLPGQAGKATSAREALSRLRVLEAWPMRTRSCCRSVARLAPRYPANLQRQPYFSRSVRILSRNALRVGLGGAAFGHTYAGRRPCRSRRCALRLSCIYRLALGG